MTILGASDIEWWPLEALLDAHDDAEVEQVKRAAAEQSAQMDWTAVVRRAPTPVHGVTVATSSTSHHGEGHEHGHTVVEGGHGGHGRLVSSMEHFGTARQPISVIYSSSIAGDMAI